MREVELYYGHNGDHEFWESDDSEFLFTRTRRGNHWFSYHNGELIKMTNNRACVYMLLHRAKITAGRKFGVSLRFNYDVKWEKQNDHFNKHILSVNPFTKIRLDMGATRYEVPGVNPGTVSSIERGVHKRVSAKTLSSYIALTSEYSDEVDLLNAYQRHYGYEETAIKEYGARGDKTLRNENPFYKIRLSLRVGRHRVPGVATSTVHNIEHGNRKIISKRVLDAYLSMTDKYDDPKVLLNEYQRLYGHEETQVQEYAGRENLRVGLCDICKKERKLTRYTMYFKKKNICQHCHKAMYLNLSEVRKRRIENRKKYRAVTTQCSVEDCSVYTRIMCVACGKYACSNHSFRSGYKDDNGKEIRYCHECVDLVGVR